MGSQVIVQKFDDLTGVVGEDIETVTYTWEGQEYEIDLNPSNRNAFNTTMSQWVQVSRKIGKAKSAKGAKTTYAQDQERKAYLAKIREWAAKNDMPGGPTGRVPQATIDAYEQAHGVEVPTVADVVTPAAEAVA